MVLRRLWIIGDNFTSCTFRKNFLLHDHGKNNEDSYIKRSFDFEVQCNSKFNSANQNMILRLQNTMAATINKFKTVPLPNYILIVLDDDLITYLDYKEEGVIDLLAKWIQWVIG